MPVVVVVVGAAIVAFNDIFVRCLTGTVGRWPGRRSIIHQVYGNCECFCENSNAR